ncbi:hypothetical protein STEG23_034700, partial [Scotinomys teguina]
QSSYNCKRFLRSGITVLSAGLGYWSQIFGNLWLCVPEDLQDKMQVALFVIDVYINNQ